MKRVAKIIICLVLSFMVVIPILAQNKAADKYKVTVFVFSGMPNPTFTIDETDAIDEMELIISNAEVPGYDEEYLSTPGYAGLMIEGFKEGKKIKEFFIPSDKSKIKSLKSSVRSFNPQNLRKLEETVLKHGLNKKVVPEKFFKKVNERNKNIE